MTCPWQTVAIVGVGLIGGSVGRALRDRGLARRVVGIGRSTASLAEDRRHGAITEATIDVARVAEADLVVLATGVAALPKLLDAVDAAVQPGTLITDTGSTKASVVAAWERRRRSRRGPGTISRLWSYRLSRLDVGRHPRAAGRRPGRALRRPGGAG
jgi:prephenate dehydrogenase